MRERGRERRETLLTHLHMYTHNLSFSSLPYLFPLLPSPFFVSDGQHTMAKVVPTSGGRGLLLKFTKKKMKCVGCRAVFEEDG